MGRVGAGEARDANVPAVSTEKISEDLIFLFHGTVRYKGGAVVSAEKACRSTGRVPSLPDVQSCPVSKEGFHW